MIVVQVRKRETPTDPPPDIADLVFPVLSEDELVDWRPLVGAVAEEILYRRHSWTEINAQIQQFRSTYLWERQLGPNNSIESMVETARHIADLPIYVRILERLARDNGGVVAQSELGALENELAMVHEELVAKNDYAGWEFRAEREGRNYIAGYGQRPFENEVVSARDGWQLILRRDDKVVLALTDEGAEKDEEGDRDPETVIDADGVPTGVLEIIGWEAPFGEEGGVRAIASDGERIRLPEAMGFDLLIRSGGATRVEVARSLLTSVFSKVWVGLNEAVGAAEEFGGDIEVAERELLEEQRQYYRLLFGDQLEG